jgi:hypothetical protein
MFTEYVLLRHGKIVTVVSTRMPLAKLAARYPDYQVTELSKVPEQVRQAYEFWECRP